MSVIPSEARRTMHRARYFFLIVTYMTSSCGVTSGLIGRRCCEETQILQGGGCVQSSNMTSSFSPPFHANLSQPLEILSWQLDPLECPYGYEVKYIPLDGAKNSLEIEKDAIYLKRNAILKNSSDFCVGLDGEGKNQYIAALCLPDIEKICRNQTCLQWCCAKAQGNCLKENSSVEFHDSNGNRTETPLDLYVIEAVPKCDSRESLSKSEFYVLRTGELYNRQTGRQYKVGEYCLEEKDEKAFVCHSHFFKIKITLLKVGLVISCVFLSLPILLLLAIPQFNDLQNRCFLCHMISLLVVDAVLFTSSHFRPYITNGHCVANAIILHYAFLSTFFWLNVMCLDLWRFIKATIKMTPLPGILADDSRNFRLYSVYAWGAPLVIVVVTAVIHFLREDQLSKDVIRPKYEIVCWITGTPARVYYHYVFVGTLLVLNFVLLVHVTVMLFRADDTIGCCSKETILTAFNRRDLDIFWQRFSLFCLMLLCWVTEILSLTIHPKEIWLLTDIINSLQGFLIFVIFISSRKKRTIIREHWNLFASVLREVYHQ